MIKKTSYIAISLIFLASGHAGASDQFGNFHQYVSEGSLKPFSRDLGGVLGSATFHSGRSLGFSGFDLGVHGGMQFRPAPEDSVLRNSDVKIFGLPWVQGEIGLPFRLDGFIRGISYQGLTISGGGLRYSLTNVLDRPWSPQVLISAVGHSVVHQDFSASHFGLNMVASFGTPVATPYVGAGFDRTRLVVRQADSDPTLDGKNVVTLESRLTAGVSVRPYPFSYVQGAFTLAHGRPGADMGLGMRF